MLNLELKGKDINQRKLYKKDNSPLSSTQFKPPSYSSPTLGLPTPSHLKGIWGVNLIVSKGTDP